jgi:hypothetical protein
MEVNIKDSRSEWLYVTPIGGLELTSAIKNEIKVGNVIFVSRDKLPRIRKRLGFPIPISKLDNIGHSGNRKFQKEINKDFFDYSKTFAVLHFSGDPKENEPDNLRKIEKAINLVSFSMLGFTTRKFDYKIEIKSFEKVPNNRVLTVDKNNSSYSLNFKRLHPLEFILNEDWKSFHEHFHYFNFLDLVNKNNKISPKWKNTLISAGNLIGKGLNSHDIHDSFLKNVIALEMLLTNQGEKIAEKLIERSGYLLDWNKEWIKNDFPQKIKEVYNKRCNYVHDGKTDQISKEDLIFTDDLVFNIYNCIIKNLDRVSSKKYLIEFSVKYQCEKKLKIQSSKYQLGKFQFMRKRYKAEEYSLL